jgi:BMFP domain-containing protein YqiC|tara:strand:+ start:135 stop:332 length:198 start_codon:yes stop_codon:yes gene_type:complete
MALDSAMNCSALTKSKVKALEARLAEYEDREQVSKVSKSAIAATKDEGESWKRYRLALPAFTDII